MAASIHSYHLRSTQPGNDAMIRVLGIAESNDPSHTREDLTAHSPVVYTSLRELANSDSWIWVRASATSLHVGLVRLRNHWSSTSTLHCSGSAEWW